VELVNESQARVIGLEIGVDLKSRNIPDKEDNGLGKYGKAVAPHGSRAVSGTVMTVAGACQALRGLIICLNSIVNRHVRIEINVGTQG